MFYAIDAEEWSKALGQVRRLRHRGNWERIGSSDAYWTKAFLAVLVDTVDGLLLEKPEQALLLSQQGILLAERIRPEDCPGGTELGKRSLRAWARAVMGSACRCLERYSESEAAFQEALWLTGKRVLPWTAAEVWRRCAALLLCQGSMASLDFVNKALEAYAGFPAAQADALVLRGLGRMYLENDLTSAALDTSKALELVDPKRGPREARTWMSAVHDLSLIYSRGCSDLEALEATLKRVRRAAATLSQHEPYRRILCLWIEALLLAPLGLSRRSEKLLNRARRWLSQHGYFHQCALCLVDLALIHFRDGEVIAGRAVLSELPGILAAADSPLLTLPEHRAAVRGLDDIQEESLAALREALGVFARRAKPPSQPFGMMAGPISSAGTMEPDSPEGAAEI